MSRERERGAALILTIVVIMALTTLALGMATFTTAEERTANTWRDAMQVRGVATAGVHIVQEMFRNPTLVPRSGVDYTDEASLNALGISRSMRSGTRYSGNFQPPFAGSWARVFGGTSNAPDVRFDCRTAAPGKCWLDAKLNALLGQELDTGRITEVKLFAPPIVTMKTYGIATVRVTAEKSVRGEVVARETIEAVIVDEASKPVVLGNGEVVFKIYGGTLSGDGCEVVHSNSAPNASRVTMPDIDPWDPLYKPVLAKELEKYYLVNKVGVFKWDVAANGWSVCEEGPEIVFRDGKFELREALDGATIVVDGDFVKRVDMTAAMTIIATGSIEIEGVTNWKPALSNRVMWIAGGDIRIGPHCCAATATVDYSGIIAARGKFLTTGPNLLVGVLVADSIHSPEGSHASFCSASEWPWTVPIKPGVSSMKAAAD